MRRPEANAGVFLYRSPSWFFFSICNSLQTILFVCVSTCLYRFTPVGARGQLVGVILSWHVGPVHQTWVLRLVAITYAHWDISSALALFSEMGGLFLNLDLTILTRLVGQSIRGIHSWLGLQVPSASTADMNSGPHTDPANPFYPLSFLLSFSAPPHPKPLSPDSHMPFPIQLA